MPLTIPQGEDAAALADWAELLILTSHPEGVSTTRLGRLLRGEGSDAAEEELTQDAGLDVDDDGVEDLELQLSDEGRGEREIRVELLLDEVSVRLGLGDAVYPFEQVEERLTQRAAPGGEAYIFLLVLSCEECAYRADRRTREAEAAFDSVALEALRRYLGRAASGLRFAKNAHIPGDNLTRPKSFRKAVTWLRKQLGLGKGHWEASEQPDRTIHWEDADRGWPPGNEPLNSYNDAGVDVVVWWRFADGRPGSPVLLAQCTVQLDWSDKVKDIDDVLWGKWIDFSMLPPQRALVLPFAVKRTLSQWKNRSLSAGVLIDRLRLIELLNELDATKLADLLNPDIRWWIADELDSVT